MTSSVELTKFEEPVAKVFDNIVDDGPELLSKMRDRIEKTRTSNSTRFGRFKEAVSKEIGKRHWYIGSGAKVFGLAITALVIAAVVLFWTGIAGFRPQAPRWNDIVLIALGVSRARRRRVGRAARVVDRGAPSRPCSGRRWHGSGA